jgi:hypothetical protein
MCYRGRCRWIFLIWSMLFAFLLPSSNRGVVGALVCLPRESRRSMLVLVAGRWAQAPLLTGVALIIDGNISFAALGLPLMISCTVYNQSSLCLSHEVTECRASVPPSSPCVVFLCIEAVVFFPALSAPTAQTLSLERWLMVVIVGSIPTT